MDSLFSDNFKSCLSSLEDCFFDVFQYFGSHFNARQERIPNGVSSNGAIEFFEFGLKNKDKSTVEQLLYSAIVYNICKKLGMDEYTDEFSGLLSGDLESFKNYYLVWRVKPEMKKSDDGFYGVYTRFAVMGI